MFLLSGFPTPCAFHRRARWNQLREELSERRRQHLSLVLRHDQGRRFSFTRRERLSALRSHLPHYRSMSRATPSVHARERRVKPPTLLLVTRSFHNQSLSRAN